MGYAERQNPNSAWNRKRNATKFIETVSTPVKDEPMVIEISNKNIFAFLRDFVCRMLNLIRPKQNNPPNLAQTS